MPYMTIETDPEVFMEHKGIKVYHVYINDNWDDGVDDHRYTLDEDGCPDYHDFEIGDLSGWNQEEEDRIAHDYKNSGDTSRRLDEYYKKIIAAALDSGELKVP